MIGIVILNYRAWEDTKRCVQSIFQNPPQHPYTIILVDNASGILPQFDLCSFLKHYRIEFIQNVKNLGYNAGNNVGIAKALEMGCSHILLSNADVRYFPDSIQIMQDYLDTHPQTGIVGPKILDKNGRIQKSCLCRKTGMKEKYLVRTRLNLFFRKNYKTYFGCDRDYERTFPVHAVLGCCFMMTAKCAEAVTPLDEHPVLYEEELILGIRMQERGFVTVYHPQAAVIHLHGGSTRHCKAFAFAQNVRSEIYYSRKYLGAKLWQIYPLYVYRVFLYLARCLWSSDFRKNWKRFLKMTGKELHTVEMKSKERGNSESKTEKEECKNKKLETDVCKL